MSQETQPNGEAKIIIQCEKCAQRLRIPLRDETLHVRCPTCGHEFEFARRVRRPPRRRKFSLGSLVVILIAGLAVYSLFRYFMDRANFESGHQAYQLADCTTAIQSYDKVINTWRILNFDSQTIVSAMQEKSECLPFQPALDQEQAGKVDQAVASFADFIKQYKSGVLVNAARDRVYSIFATTKTSALVGENSCGKLNLLIDEKLVPQPEETLPPFYLACGQLWDAGSNTKNSFDMYRSLLSDYPTRPEASLAEAALLKNEIACQATSVLQGMSAIAARGNFMPSLYSACGKAYEEKRDWAHAIEMYNSLLTEYPNSSSAAEAEVALARAIVAQAKATSGGEIPEPAPSGGAASGTVEVVIQNSSPEELRIVFSGPDSRVEKLQACSSCSRYHLIEPTSCPQQGKVGRYTLQPGEYDVVVESLSDSSTKPWTGHWALADASKYDSCFYIVTTYSP